MSNKTPLTYAISFGLALTPICFSTVSAQERCKVSEDATAAKSNYTQQHVLDVGDVSGHQIRVYELHRTYANDKPNCENLKRTELWSRGYSDYIDRNGRTWGYDVISFENGDKIFLNLMERAKPRSHLMVLRKAPSQVSLDTPAAPDYTRAFEES